MQLRQIIILPIIAFALTGCAKTAHLYPANDAAAKTGVLEANYVAYGTGHTDVEIKMPDGEVLKGETSLVRGGSVGFGNIFATVYGPGGAAYGNASSTSYSMPGGSPGTASVFGSNRTYGQCEFYNDNFSGHGYGACKINKNQLYRLQY